MARRHNKPKRDIRAEIVGYLQSRSDQTFKGRDLASRLKIPKHEYPEFQKILRELFQSSTIARYKGHRYGRARQVISITGSLLVKSQGFGFVIRDDGGEDIYIGRRNLGSAMHKDRVRVEIRQTTAGRLSEGRVVDVVQRARERLVGVFQEAQPFNFVIPDDREIHRDIYISERQRGETRIGQKVVVEMIHWGDGTKLPEGKVIQILGWPDDPGVDVLSVIHAFELPVEFPKAILKEAKAISGKIPKDEIDRRLDLRDQMIFTIDPEDAKDFDDAVSLSPRKKGGWTLGVHIADVSHFVATQSTLDQEALKRGTSVYLVDRVIPMLPHAISNELCSLVPHEDRLTFSIIMRLSKEGEVEDYEIRESIIYSQHRLTYQEAQNLIDDSMDNGDEIRPPPSKEFESLRPTLREMANVSRILYERWQRDGTIDFDLPEAKVELNDQGFPTALGVRERLASHRLVESFMLLANRTVAEHIQSLSKEKGMKYPFVYRVHEKPQGKKLEEFAHLVRVLGYPFDPGKSPTPKKFQKLLAQVRGTAHEPIVEEVALRSMMKAVYTTKNLGHFGLAFKAYTHFTSPIRRYPDLMVHRLLKGYSKDDPSPALPVGKLQKICDIATDREISAQEAERESVRAKQVEFMEGLVGETFQGIISGVMGFGVFVEIPEFLVEGLVHVDDLEKDRYSHDVVHYCLAGERHGKVYRLGDPLNVQVARVWRELRRIDFVLAEEAEESNPTSRKSKTKRKSKK